MANDNVTDGHCVYVTFKKGQVVDDGGAKSCGPTVWKYHGPSITNYQPCITGHWSCGAWRL